VAEEVAKGGEISRRAFHIAYVGESADDHSMDVEALGPALLAFGKLVRAANREINGDRASVRVLVASDFEDKCFNINFEVVQTIWKEIKDLLETGKVDNASDLLKHIGVISTAAAGVAATVFGYLKWKNGRKVESAEPVKGSSGAVAVKVEGDNNIIHVSNHVYRLVSNKDVLDAVEATLAPIDQTGEAKSIEFRENDKPLTVLDQREVKAIIASCEAGPDPLPTVMVAEIEKKPKVVTASLYAYGPVFDEKAPNWRFRWNRDHIYADVRQTSIAKDALRRGGSFVNDRYKVKMEVTPPTTDDGTPHYKILEVLEFTPADQQISMQLKKPRKKAAKKAKKQAAK
jgi:hypothetical protein